MKSLKSILVSFVILTGLILTGCKKSNDSRDPGGISAVFTLGGSPGSCTGFTIAGSYVAGTALSGSNTVAVQVSVTSTGAYSITTATVNGIKFSGSGSFTTTGTQSVTLTGSGTPATAGDFNYAVTAGSASCTFSVTAISGGGGSAVFSLGGSPGSCTGFTSAGTYTVGTALTGANTVSMQVNVTTVGTYLINTPAVNGVSFSTSGTFASTGAQTVTLTGAGTPVAAGAFNYAATAGANTCAFSITVTGGASISAQFNSCDNIDAEWEISGDKPKIIETVGKKEGAGWIKADLLDGVDYMHFIDRRPTPLNAGVTEENGQLKFWFYVTDVSQLRLSGPGVDPGQIELTSDGRSDFKEYNWNTDSVINLLHNGWNEVKLDFTKAYKSADGGPDVAGFNLFRIYFWTNTAAHPDMQIGLDDIRVQQK